MALWGPFVSLVVPDFRVLILASIGVAVVWFPINTAVTWYRLSSIPGPPLAALSNLPIYYSVKSFRFHLVLCELPRKYGKLVRIAPNALVLSDPETLWRINGARSVYTRGGWYGSSRLNPYGDSIVSEMDTAKHDKRKAKLAFGFSGKGLTDLEGKLNTQLNILVNTLRTRINNRNQGQTALDIGRILRYFQVDLITSAGIGETWGDLPLDKDHFRYLAVGDALIPSMHAITMVPWLRHILFSPLFLRLFGPDMTVGWLGELHKAVEQRAKGGEYKGDGSDMLGEWLKHGLSPVEAELDLAVQLPAGTETSISTIRSIMLYLMTTPCAYQKLKEEIRDNIRNGQISAPTENEEAKKLPYLQAIINESLRIAPPLTARFAKRVPHSGDVICGKSVPEGTEIHVDFVSLMQDQEVFGSDVDIFRPERLLDCDEPTRTLRLKVVDLNFGHGRWLCLGKVLARMEMNKIFVELFRYFDFQILNPERPWRRKSTLSMWINDFFARVTDSPIC